ncbi:MAG TPA: hypothetical protein VFH78_04460 [Candidatus Thermoplasmatota archaeon]|nr:hypothetical protein [Candidatus Thermoplasmatota archaeon]
MRALLAIALVVLLAAPALAQTTGQPLAGKYESSYTIYGRALDSRGLPVRGGVAMIELEQEGVRAAPLRAGINCKGDFIAEFNLLHVDPKGRIKVTVLGPNGQGNATTTASLEPFFRRSDVIVTIGQPWPHECRNEIDVWDVSASMRVRILNRTEPYNVQGETIHARPHMGIYKMRFEPPGGAEPVCPPHPQAADQCELFQADARGDIRYTFTLDAPFSGGGVITLTSVQNESESYTIPVDPRTRVGVKYIEASGRGAPPELYETPAPALVLLLAAALVAAMAFSRRQR